MDARYAVESFRLEEESFSSCLENQQVLVQMLGTPVHFLDLNTEGFRNNTFPRIGGNEGVGRVRQIGSNVSGLSVNDHVIITQPGLGTWKTQAIFSSENLMKVPTDVPIEYAASISYPLTALRILSDFVQLNTGDVVIQNAANSIIGTSLIQLAKSQNVKTINIVPEGFKEKDYLKSIGGDVILSESEFYNLKSKEVLSTFPRPKLAVNIIGGESSTKIARLLGEGGVMVTLGGIGQQGVSIPSGAFIFNDIQAVGFNLAQFLRGVPLKQKAEDLKHLISMIQNKQLKLNFKSWKFSSYKDAISKSKGYPLAIGQDILTFQN